MKILKLLLLISMFILPGAFAQDDTFENIKVPSGMELRRLGNGYYTIVSKSTADSSTDGLKVEKIGGVNMLVPEGMRVLKKGSMVTVESRTEYLARKLTEINERFDKLEAEQETLKKTIKDLKKSANNSIVGKNINDLKPQKNTSVVVAK